jgi:hypothetical protein
MPAKPADRGASISITFYRDDALVWSGRGGWTYEEQQGDAGITFAKFRFGIPGYSSERGYWFVVPQKTFTGQTKLCFDIDLKRCFQSLGPK